MTQPTISWTIRTIGPYTCIIRIRGRSAVDAQVNYLTDEARRRLRDLVELAPTKNAELAEAWGMANGAEVHRYLEEQLRDFYYRDTEKLIRPTGAAIELVEATGQ